ncbi:hypothetical protein HDU67_010255 [Dinochytrium kinnereticum]|nr:hypothetical protein HDU67_010255 [Dinochytrium kinnereticum]
MKRFKDVQIPLEAAARLRGIGLTVPIIAATGNVVKGTDYQHLQASGITDALSKPITKSKVQEILNKYGF